MTLNTGDILITTSVVPFVRHYGVLYYENGSPIVAHNSFSTGKIELDPLDKFIEGRDLVNVLHAYKSIPDQELKAKILKLVEKGEGYKFFSFNCEDFVRKVTGRNIGADQRYVWILIIILVIIILFSFKRS